MAGKKNENIIYNNVHAYFYIDFMNVGGVVLTLFSICKCLFDMKDGC